MVQAAAKALKEREAALLTLQAIEADLEKRRHSVAVIEEEHQRVQQHPVLHLLCCVSGVQLKLGPELSPS